MKKLLLSLLAVAGAWTSAGAQTAIEGYKLITDKTNQTASFPINNSSITGQVYSYTDGNSVSFTMTSKGDWSISNNRLVPYKLSQGETFDIPVVWNKNNHLVVANNVSIVTNVYVSGASYCAINKTATTSSTSVNTATTATKTITCTDKITSGQTFISYYQEGRLGILSGTGTIHINSVSIKYDLYHYTLDFTKANTLMSQAEALYNGLSDESKASAEGVALLNAKNTTATFKTAHENEAVDVKAGTLRAELTADENAMQAAIDAFTCNLADTDEQYTVNGKTVTNVTLTRTIKAGTWNTLCLPFSMDIPAGWTVKELSGVTYSSETNSYDAQFSAVTAIEAGKPYIVKVNEQVDEITRSDAAGFTLAAVPTPVEVSNNDGTLYFGGIFVPMDLAGCYFISGGKFYYAAPGKGNHSNGYRALFTVVGGSSSTQLIYTVDEGALTLIDAPELIDNDAAPVFDLQGRRVNAPVSGQLYVKNGKKFIQK